MGIIGIALHNCSTYIGLPISDQVCQIFKLKNNQAEFQQLERLINKNLRTALKLMFTPINMLIAEAKEPLLSLRYSYYILLLNSYIRAYQVQT